MDDVVEAIKKMSNHRAPGEDRFPAEVFKYGGMEVLNGLFKLIKKIWICEEMPQEWNTSIIIPLHKKNDKTICTNYRGISLLNVGYKILAKVINAKLKPYAEKAIGEYQCGFRSGRAPTDQMFALRLIMEKCYEFNVTVHQLYIDFQAAYDSINRGKLYSAMLELGVPKKLVNLTRMTLQGTKSKVKTQGMVSEEFNIQQGLKQGDSLSGTLFNLALGAVMRKIPTNPGGTIFNRTSQNLAFADDICMLGINTRYLSENVKVLEEEAAKIGLLVNRAKTKYMVNTRNKTRWRNMTQFEGYVRVK